MEYLSTSSVIQCQDESFCLFQGLNALIYEIEKKIIKKQDLPISQF